MAVNHSAFVKAIKPFAARWRDYMTAPVRDALAEVATRQAATCSAPAAQAAAPAGFDISHLLHDCRSAYLRTMPPGADTLLSAGCAGTWYFNWVARTYGPVRRHIGIEYYTPKPADLPADVEWIANTVSDMSGVGDATCDLVFSGENLEHLWPEEVAGFFVEAARVTKGGGYLVIDSPNRVLTAPLNWSHPEHTVELTVDEATDLMEKAGFDVTKCVGIWLCRDPRTGRVLPFDPNINDPEWALHERVLAAHNNPMDSFIWWIEGRRNGRAPDVAGINARMQEIFAAAWPERTRRMLVGTGTLTSRNNEDWVTAKHGTAGPLIFGPYMPLKKGRYRADFVVDIPPGAIGSIGRCEVITGDVHAPPIASANILIENSSARPQTLAIEFQLDQLEFGIQFRCISDGTSEFAVRRVVDIVRLDD